MFNLGGFGSQLGKGMQVGKPTDILDGLGLPDAGDFGEMLPHPMMGGGGDQLSMPSNPLHLGGVKNVTDPAMTLAHKIKMENVMGGVTDGLNMFSGVMNAMRGDDEQEDPGQFKFVSRTRQRGKPLFT